MAFLSSEQLEKICFKNIGKNVLVSDKASIYNAKYISLGDNTRIDDFCILSAGDGGISLGRNVHIACYASLIGKGKIFLDDFVGISSKCSIYSSNDDYSGDYMTGPTVALQYTNVTHAPVFIGKHSIVGASSIVLPGITIGVGVAVGAFALVNKDCDDFGVYIGIPAKKSKNRNSRMIDFERQLINEEMNASYKD